MHHSTDLKPADGSTADSPTFAEKAARVLNQVAAHFTAIRPTELLEPDALLVSIGAESYNVCGRSLGSDSAHVSRTALSAAPERPDGITRGEYALHLRRAIGVEFAEPALTGGVR
ncbi:hypothetical protein [Streptomyces kronopolitis]|uniref:hypothetical protein n=1 Tax=Streptomyces kronopolitis TaxID=1612435 RepID=UPI003D957735